MGDGSGRREGLRCLPGWFRSLLTASPQMFLLLLTLATATVLANRPLSLSSTPGCVSPNQPFPPPPSRLPFQSWPLCGLHLILVVRSIPADGSHIQCPRLDLVHPCLLGSHAVPRWQATASQGFCH